MSEGVYVSLNSFKGLIMDCFISPIPFLVVYLHFDFPFFFSVLVEIESSREEGKVEGMIYFKSRDRDFIVSQIELIDGNKYIVECLKQYRLRANSQLSALVFTI